MYVTDLADVYVRALERAPAGSIFNPSSGSISMAEWAEAISHAIGRPGETVAWSPVEAMRYVGSFAHTWQLNQMLDGSRAREVLGWQPEGPKAFDEFAYGSYAQQSAVR